ncbi:MAG: glycerophosphodiester phosphodiesterase [Betaproteobacteria bacterium]|nr:glycerophosphodiester phosphodiesterase [Betaproteobacteria bacterium]MDH5221770.1 glycerophosphodiester phosphodiesterase [Betaproteobacteria bacterium]
MSRWWAIAALFIPVFAGAFDLQGHRGARGVAPENTLQGFAAALAAGVDTLELDVGVTRDGVVVIHHDRRLNPDIARGPDGRWIEAPGPLLRSLTYDELRRYDVGRLRPGSTYAALYPEQKPADGARIPRLAELFALVRKAGNAQVRFNIETKISPAAPEETLAPVPFARAVVKEIRAASVAARASIQSFDWRTLQEVERIAPEIATVYLTGRRRGKASQPAAVHAAGGKTWSPNFEELDSAALIEARKLELKVVPWTVNEPGYIERFLDLGVDGLITDYPERVRAELARRGLPLPAPTPVER